MVNIGILILSQNVKVIYWDTSKTKSFNVFVFSKLESKCYILHMCCINTCKSFSWMLLSSVDHIIDKEYEHI